VSWEEADSAGDLVSHCAVPLAIVIRGHRRLARTYTTGPVAIVPDNLE
jgi:hypothetical protein